MFHSLKIYVSLSNVHTKPKSQDHTVDTNGKYGNLATFTYTRGYTHIHTHSIHIFVYLKKDLLNGMSDFWLNSY
jgi:hypothetical protein